MKKLLQAAFHITLFQILLILGSGAFKYWLNATGLTKQLTIPFIILGAFALMVLILALGLGGIIENKGHTPETWINERPNSNLRKVIVSVVTWGPVFSIVVFYAFAIYLIAPTSVNLFIAILLGIIIRNVVNYYSKKEGADTRPHS